MLICEPKSVTLRLCHFAVHECDTQLLVLYEQFTYPSLQGIQLCFPILFHDFNELSRERVVLVCELGVRAG